MFLKWFGRRNVAEIYFNLRYFPDRIFSSKLILVISFTVLMYTFNTKYF